MKRADKGMKAIVHAALTKMLLHSIRNGYVEGVKIAIEKGVNLKYCDKKHRNLFMYEQFI